MQLKDFFPQDDAGNLLTGGTATVYLKGTQTLATGLADAAGNPVANPVPAAASGRIQFRAPMGDYDVLLEAGAFSLQVEASFVEAGDLSDLSNIIQNISVDEFTELPSETQVRTDDTAASMTVALNGGVELTIAETEGYKGLLSNYSVGEDAVTISFYIAIGTVTTRNIGFAIGNGADRRWYGWGGGGGLVWYPQAGTNSPNILLENDPSRVWNNGDQISLSIQVAEDKTGTITLAVDDGTESSVAVSDIPEGPIYLAARGEGTVTFTRMVVTGQNIASQISEIDDQLSDLGDRVSMLESDEGELPNHLPAPLVSAGINHLIGYGQSNSIGADAGPVISTTQPYSNITFQGGPRSWAGGAWSYAPFKPLVEDLDTTGGSGGAGVNLGETPCSGAANYATTVRAIAGHDPSNHVILASTAGRGSYAISQLKKGTAWYDNLIAQITEANTINPDYSCHAVMWVQGERDAYTNETPYATYKSELLQLQADIESDVRGIVGNNAPVYMLMVGLSYRALFRDDVARAQFDATTENDKLYIVCPSYRLPYENGLHFSNVGAKLAGAYFGKSYAKMLDGLRPDILKPISATIMSDVLRVRFLVPQSPLVFDTSSLASVTDNGFVVLDDDEQVNISGIDIDGDDVLITLSDVPSGVVTVRYALDYTGAGRGVNDEGAGNLRDSAPETTSISGVIYQLFNAAPAFEMTAVTLGL